MIALRDRRVLHTQTPPFSIDMSKVNSHYHETMAKMLEARLTEPPVERIEGYEPVPPYAPKFIATEQGWYVVDSNGVPVMGQWNNNSDTEPPSSLLETIADLNK